MIKLKNEGLIMYTFD